MRGARGALVEELARRPHRPRAWVRFQPSAVAARRRPRSGALCASARGAPGSVLKAQPVPTRGPAAVMPHQVIAMRRAPNEPERCTEQLVRSTLPNSPTSGRSLHESRQPGNRTNPSRRPRSCSNRCRGRRTDTQTNRSRGIAAAGAASRPGRMADRARGARTDSGPASIELGPRLRSRDRRRRTRGRRTGRSCSRPPPCARA